MAVPSRAFVGVVVFGLITVLVVLPYTALVLSGYRPPPDAPYQLVFPDQEEAWGLRIFLVTASVFSVALLAFSWRALLQGARRDAERRRRHEELKKQIREYQVLRQESQRRAGGRPPTPPQGPPPGFT